MQLIAYLKIIRWKNLLLIIYVFFLLKFQFFNALFLETKLSNGQFLLLLLSVLLITASGNIINDIYDIEADKINKPSKLIVSKLISKEKALQWYKITNTIGITFGITLCLMVNKPQYSFIFIAASLLLYLYSKRLKGLPLIGNLVVSILISFSILILPLFDIDFFIENKSQIIAIQIIIALSFFAFTLNLVREIVKDLQDVNGDNLLNLNTLPIVLGRKRIGYLASVLCIIPMGLLVYIILNYSNTYQLTVLYLLVFILIPLLYISLKLKTSKSKKEFQKMSKLLKILMFLGINSILFFSLFQ